MIDDRKIKNFWERVYFLDKKTEKISILCERNLFCLPPKSIEDFDTNGCTDSNVYEVAEWHLKEDKNDILSEYGEYKGEEIEDVAHWIWAVCDKYNLITSDEAKTTIVEKYKIVWEDGTIEEWEKKEWNKYVGAQMEEINKTKNKKKDKE